ncbi:transcriptional regulator, HxlR family [Seinonella peptonophila]|uniref:Transcriptional regulator, HxlR family n=1 Tax=Seinonella peptonophila TaxID=112248 RepID=A0A1M4UA53_9BACL|nr:helix-turn-helix domain-containing protein [Seinonella peptonophila]SHE53450.1 transcriptional regulator, HxlR family [Seinonella peptonophila]
MEPKRFNCSIEATLEVLSGKWKTLILYHLVDHTLRFAELKRKIPDISQKVLTEQLRQLEKDGLIFRKDYEQNPPKVEYSLTDYGNSLKSVLSTMCRWGENRIRQNNWQLKL